MTFPTIQTGFASGELSPSLFGRTDLAKYHQGAFTQLNFVTDYRGGAASRAGFAYVGRCRQLPPAAPPRDIPFQFSLTQGYVLEFGDFYMRVKFRGAYVTENPLAITGATTGATATLTIPGNTYATGDWIFVSGTGTDLDGLTWIVTIAGATVSLSDLFDNHRATSGSWDGGGTAARIFTVVSPYAAVDLPYLKYTQSADTMTLACVNTDTLTEYPSYELVRSGQTSWTFTADNFSASIGPPVGVAATAVPSTDINTFYSYVVTAVDAATGEESVASLPANVENNDISANAGSNIIAWDQVPGAGSYNVYAATPGFMSGVSVGVLYGFLGSALGTTFTDSNIVADFTNVPPTHQNPFARGAITSVTVTGGGSGYTQGNAGAVINTSTGSGFVGQPIIVGGSALGFLIANSGQNYTNGDTITITGDGTGATATINLGPLSGTYPGTVAYFQQRRVYASSLNNPDTMYFSQPGAFNNMDFSNPISDSDAIVATPWSQQVNGIQFMIAMPGGLVPLTGLGAWQVSGSNNAALTPSDISAQPQAYNGCNNILPPIIVGYDIIYGQAKGSIFRDLSYNFFVNIYTGTDLTVLSNHLFTGFTFNQWCWAEEPYKIIWCVRNDGVMLSLTYLKEQDVYAWARHNTNGLFLGACAITEPPVDAVYVITQRNVFGKWWYFSERMDDRLWNSAEDCFCVDAGLSTALEFPDVTVFAAAASGTGVSVTSSAPIFGGGNVGRVLRMGGGIGTVTSIPSTSEITVDWTTPITATQPNDPNNLPLPAAPGTWSLATPVSVVRGLNHLEGLTVSILADGNVVPQQVVTNGSVTLPQPASLVTVGLPFTAQLQSVYLDVQGQGTVQGKRKSIPNVVIRCESTRGISVGTNQIDASTQPNGASATWTNMVEVKERNANINAGASIPLFTGDIYMNMPPDWAVQGQVAIEQTFPLPATVLAVVANFNLGDTAG